MRQPRQPSSLYNQGRQSGGTDTGLSPALGSETVPSDAELDAVRRMTAPVKRMVEEGKLGRKVRVSFTGTAPKANAYPVLQK